MPIPKTTTKAEQDAELARIGIDGDDGGDELDSKRQPSRRSNERRPRTVSDIDTAAIYAKFNNPKPGAKLGATDED